MTDDVQVRKNLLTTNTITTTAALLFASLSTQKSTSSMNSESKPHQAVSISHPSMPHQAHYSAGNGKNSPQFKGPKAFR